MVIFFLLIDTFIEIKKKISIWVDLLLFSIFNYPFVYLYANNTQLLIFFVILEIGWYRLQTSILKTMTRFWFESWICESIQESVWPEMFWLSSHKHELCRALVSQCFCGSLWSRVTSTSVFTALWVRHCFVIRSCSNTLDCLSTTN